jgi:hypothetical protein
MASRQRGDSAGSWNRIASILGGDKCKYAEDKENTRLHSQEELMTMEGQLPQEQLTIYP